MLSPMPTRKTSSSTHSKTDGADCTGNLGLENLGLLGVGFDGDYGHKRLTHGDGFCVVGGSAETHERMQDLVMRMNEKLRKQGRRFQDLSRPEFEALARESM